MFAPFDPPSFLLSAAFALMLAGFGVLVRRRGSSALWTYWLPASVAVVFLYALYGLGFIPMTPDSLNYVTFARPHAAIPLVLAGAVIDGLSRVRVPAALQFVAAATVMTLGLYYVRAYY